ncbi:hypothetical protein LAZ67_3001704 [Cordylochernes scorpioides]|uniref:Uncharacterized protein n=1 Tax=Cordylochernes scorpioides TaxID=51811 RepID=A0ABY6KAG4_9ARAC|nr:hypothetical protein LAZ67_3001704 [Cordylochernes scorpioides]
METWATVLGSSSDATLIAALKRSNTLNLLYVLQGMVKAGRSAGSSKKKYLGAWEAVNAIQYKPPFLQKLKLWYLVICGRRSVMLREKAKSYLIKNENYMRKPLRRLGLLLQEEGKLPDPELVLFLTYDEITQLVHAHVPYIVNKGGRKIRKGSRRTKLSGVLQASCCLKRSDCCLPPTPVYFLEDSRRFYELLSPVLLLLSLTVLQLVSL